MTDVVLCIDIGTTSLKAGLITAEGEVVATSSAKIICAEEEKSFIATKWMKAFFVAVKKICISLENSLGDSKEKVLRVLGTPNYESNEAEGVEDLFFYAEAKKESRIFFDPQVVTRDIYVYTFTKGKVSDIQHLTLDDAQKVAYESDTTKVGGKELSVLKQLAENFGRYNAGGNDSTQRR